MNLAKVTATFARTFEQMKSQCRICHHPLKNSRTSVELWRDGISVEVLNVPARVCANCGEAYIAIDVAERLDILADAVVKKQAQLERTVQHAFAVTRQPQAKAIARRPRPPATSLRGLKVAWQ